MKSPGKVRSEFYTKVGMIADFLELNAVNYILHFVGRGFLCLVIFHEVDDILRRDPH